ncbi:MAG TPA: NPCBM/NEW2 domain-containing protein [Nocardioides sp.]|uniref:NPCBM/NEW2 domain-containing protein n=1 Tax=Nocardioides sp. TaxID=35761 RepID=UPI002E30948B|nr:NPCBM/NEW2 domain-containing protein [Nocardioides sp.]HEX5088862.1 NPCBM/NEW2 domain-containing protein [Nocardioides sp.]
MYRTTIAAGVVLAATLSATALATADAAPSHDRSTSVRAGAYKVTATVNKTEPLQGSKVKIKGSVKPAAAGSKVTLQLRYADQKKWTNVATDTLSGSGKFTFKDKVSSVRERKYRVVKAASAGHAAGHSKSLKVTVFGWRELTSLNPATASGFGEWDTGVKMNGVAYPNSLRTFPPFPGSGSGNSIDYNLNRACKSFRGVAGLDDSSAVAGTATVSMATDGTARYSGSFALTQSAPVTFDVTKVFRLSITASLANGGTAAVGTPQVLCSF